MTRREFLALALAAPVALAAPAAFARRLGGTPVALVTADSEEHVAAIDLSTGRIVKRIPTLAGP
jgi:anti-sigma-K factor RskA